MNCRTKEDLITADAITFMLRRRYPAREWAAFVELRGFAGFSHGSTIDFFAVNTWPSKRFWRIAVEVKVSRGDFLRELDRPQKRLQFVDVAHEFWFAAPAGMIKPPELPDGAGLLEVAGDKLRAKVRAKQREPEEPEFGFAVVMLKAAADERERHERRFDELAEFAGRQIGIEDLRRLAHKWHVRERDRIADQVRADIARERRERAKDGRGQELAEWYRCLRVLQRVAGEALGRSYSDGCPTPDQVSAWLEALQERNIGRAARQLRDVVSELELLAGNGNGRHP